MRTLDNEHDQSVMQVIINLRVIHRISPKTSSRLHVVVVSGASISAWSSARRRASAIEHQEQVGIHDTDVSAEIFQLRKK